jgi:AcrR family transcriptional regulator
LISTDRRSDNYKANYMEQISAKDEKKLHLITSSIQLFTQQPYKSTTIKEITDNAQMGKSTFYEYFESKDDLLCDIVGYFHSQFTLSVLPILQNMSPEEKLRTLIKGIFQIDMDNENMKHLAMEFFSLSLTDNKKMIEMTQEIYDNYLKLVMNALQEGIENKTFKEGIDIQIIAESYLAALDGYKIQHYTLPNYDIERSAMSYIEMLINHIKRS